MPSKTFYKQEIDTKELKIKRLEFENKQLTNTVKELHLRNEHLQAALNEKLDMIKQLAKRKWYEFWK